jgi:hypothetical protein
MVERYGKIEEDDESNRWVPRVDKEDEKYDGGGTVLNL